MTREERVILEVEAGFWFENYLDKEVKVSVEEKEGKLHIVVEEA